MIGIEMHGEGISLVEMTSRSFNRSRLVIRAFLLLGSLALSSAAFCAEDAPSSKVATEPAAKPLLVVGSKAPDLESLKWLKGEPITSFDPAKVYLVECWATWCGPCVAAIPHLNGLHNKFTEKEEILSGTDPADPDLLRGMAFSIKGDREDSLAHYRKAVKAGNGDAGALLRVAHGLLDYGVVRDNDLALQSAREAASKDANPFFRHFLARAEHAAGNKETAIAILEKLVEEEDRDTYREDLRALKENKQAPQPTRRGTGR